MPSAMHIGSRLVGPGHPTYLIAELSANHNQRFERALELVRAAKEAGADAIKLQTYTADTLTVQASQEHFKIRGGTLWDGRTLHDLYGEAQMPWEWHEPLKRAANDLGMDLFSTPFDPTAVDFLEKLGVPVYKVASFELVDLPLIERVARTGKPIIMSTGMATLAEIDDAVGAARRGGATQLALLKCTSAYPAPPEGANLRTIPHLAQSFDVLAGLSDHTMGPAAPIAAVALGACIIEKHFTLARADGGPDGAFSLEPAEFRAMVDAVRATEKALGAVHYGFTEKEKANRALRRSLFVVEDVRAGEPLTERNVRSIRPGHGLPPKLLPEVLGRRAARDLAKGTPLAFGDFTPDPRRVSPHDEPHDEPAPPRRGYLLTGTSRGLGEALLDVVLEEPAAQAPRVVALARSFTEAQRAEARRSPERLRLVALDLTQLERPRDGATGAELEELFAHEALDEVVFVDNAAALHQGPVGALEDERIAEALALNVRAPLLLANALVALADERRRPLHIVHVSTGAAQRAIAGWPLYCATKAAAKAFYDVLRDERARRGEATRVRVACVDPGVVDTAMQRALRDAAGPWFPAREQFVALHAQGRLRAPHEAARWLLASQGLVRA